MKAGAKRLTFFTFFLMGVCSLWVAAARSEAAALGRQLYVNGVSGSNGNDGLSREAAFQTIQRACDVVKPGDSVLVAKGVYYENVSLKTAGTIDAPITFIAESYGRHDTLITGADRHVRENKVRWELGDPQAGIYSIPFPFEPHRVNYGDIDLFPYGSFEQLKRFHLADDFPGPEHGFFYDGAGQRLYVCLHKSGRYGPTDPNQQVMNIGGPPGSGARRHIPTEKRHVLFGVVTPTPAYVVIDGFTFQSAGTSAVLAGTDEVTVKNCWFIGCPAGVSGRGEFEGRSYKGNHVRVLQCDYSESDVYQDMADVINRWGGDKSVRDYFWWHRKFTGLEKRCYERGMVIEANDDWEVANCYMHDCFEALSYLSFGKGSTNGHVHHNVFNRSIDNHIEFEYELKDFVVHDNLFADSFRPVSYQAFERTPGPIWFFRNVIVNSDEVMKLFEKAGKGGGSWNKFPINHPIPKPGLLIYNNTVLSRNRWIEGFNENLHIFNNMFWVSNCDEKERHSSFNGNVVYSESPVNADLVAGPDGIVVSTRDDLGLIVEGDFADWRSLRIRLKPNSPAVRVGIPPPAAFTTRTSPQLDGAGAVSPKAVWTPPMTGPMRP